MLRCGCLWCCLGVMALIPFFIACDDEGENLEDENEDSYEADWEWFDVPDMICRDGSSTGFAVRWIQGSDKVAIFLQGGGACLTPDSCSQTAGNFNEDKFNEQWSSGSISQGLLDPQRGPLMDWNIVYVPYCTGDLHLGNKEDGYVPGVAQQQRFVGYRNMSLMLTKVKGLFDDVSKVLLVGVSAGGFGAVYNYDQVAQVFPNRKVVLLNDSGTLLEDDEAMTLCLQLTVRVFFNIDSTLPPDCAECFSADGDGLAALPVFLAEKYPQASFGFFSTMRDKSMRTTLGYGLNNCEGGGMIPEDVYRQALLAMRDDFLLPTERWSTFYYESDKHGAVPYQSSSNTTGLNFYDVAVGEQTLAGWTQQLLNGVPDSVGP